MCAETTQRSRNNRNTTIFAYVLLPTDVNSYAVELAMRTHGQQFQSDCLFIGHVLVYGSAQRAHGGELRIAARLTLRCASTIVLLELSLAACNYNAFGVQLYCIYMS